MEFAKTFFRALFGAILLATIPGLVVVIIEVWNAREFEYVDPEGIFGYKVLICTIMVVGAGVTATICYGLRQRLGSKQNN